MLTLRFMKLADSSAIEDVIMTLLLNIYLTKDFEGALHANYLSLNHFLY